MGLSPGARVGLYEIVSLLGAGGMGEVYRARDTRLGREVAIKVLPEPLASDAERIARLEREARALAALNHPHIATLHGMEESAGRHFLIMELVEGETLADRLQRGPVPVADALRIAIPITDALEAAHEKGIVHRDLKPANVKVAPDEKVKVLDFGLARLGAADTAGSAGSLTHSPTLSMMATQAGVILGTAAYMSPEQAKGLAADHRSDVFSFGVVLYEMLTGRQPFQGETAPDIMASVLAREPALDALPPGLNPRLSELIRRCLEKLPRKRWQAVGDLRAEIEAVAAAPHAQPTVAVVAAPPPPLWKRAVPIAAASLVAAAVTSAAWWSLRPTPAAHPVTRFTFTLPDGQNVNTIGPQLLAISPDGRQFAYIANGQLNVRAMSDLEAKPLAKSDISAENFAGFPTFSPDGGSIAFWAGPGPSNGAIKRVAVAGGPAVTVCQVGFPFGLSWSGQWMLFVQPNKGIMRVSAGGGQPELLVPIKDAIAWGPQLLPDGDTVLYTLSSIATTLQTATSNTWDRAQIVARSLKSGTEKTLVNGGLGATYLPSGHIVYAVGGVLFAVPFDARRLEVTGGAVPVVEGVRRPLTTGAAPGTVYYGVSETGTLIYLAGPASFVSAQLDLILVDRHGTLETLKVQPNSYGSPRISPNGKYLAVSVEDSRDANISVYELSGASAMRQLTFGGKNRLPVWAPDSARIAFQSDREGDRGVFQQPADGSGTAQRLTKPDQHASHIPHAWSPDGKTLLYDEVKDGRFSLWAWSIPDKKAERVGDIESTTMTNAAFSRDGRWIAYVSNPGIAAGVYVRPFPITGSMYRIGPGSQPLWSPDGRSLSYLRNLGLHVVSVRPEAGLTVGNPTPLSTTAAFMSNPGPPRTYDITPDGERFIAVTAAEQTQESAGMIRRIEVVLNWQEELKARVATAK